MALADGVLASCSSYPPPASFLPPRPIDALSGPRWQAITDALPGKLRPTSSNICASGAPACMDAIVAEMTSRLDSLAGSCSHLAPFLLMYREVSEQVRASVRARRYEESAYASHLDAVFATLYFHAIDAWRSGRLDEVPGAWQIAFSAAEHRRVSALGDLLLGMNAHISRDLPYALAAVGLRHANGTDATPDVIAVNADIARAQAPALDAVALRFDSSVATLPRIAGPFVDPQNVGVIIAAWRLEAIGNARKLLAARSPDSLERVETTIDDNATIRSLLILRAASYRAPAVDTRARDRQCRGASSLTVASSLTHPPREGRVRILPMTP